MLTESRFDFERPMVGLEIELNLVDEQCEPAMRNAEVLEAIADPAFVTELGRFNIEINVPPRRLAESGFTSFEESVRRALNAADPKAQAIGAQTVMVGILPTLRPEHVTPDNLSENPRYSLLDQQIFAARGEDLEIVIDGVERLQMVSDTITPEAACTSTQVHLQVSPDDFAGYWNAAQAIAGVQVAVGANSPYLFGRELFAESRIPLFEQSTDTRPEELKVQGVRPRVWFGERWVTSIFDLFEENSRYFPALLPITSDEDPAAVLDAGGVPSWRSSSCTTARSTAGTGRSTTSPAASRTCGWRTACCRPGRPWSTPWPTRPSSPAWCGRWPTTTGRCGARCRSRPRTRTSRRAPATASPPRSTGRGSATSRPPSWWSASCCRARRRGWRCGGSPTPRAGGCWTSIEHRCLRGANGATWQTAEVHRRERAGESREEALRGMLGRYLDAMHSNEPVHLWESD